MAAAIGTIAATSPMETLLTLLGLACRLLGFAERFEQFMQKRAAKKQAQAIADTPTTDKEWTDAAKNGDL